MTNETAFPIYTCVGQEPITVFEVIGKEVFDYPFFNEGISEYRRSMFGKEDTAPATIPDRVENKSLEIKGFIFHASHCGSTLLARMLNRSKQVRVVSETEAINGLLLSYVLYDLPRTYILDHLKRIIEAYRLPIGSESRLIFKLTSWNVFFIELFQEIYPEVNWIFIDRNTEDAVASLLKSDTGFAQWWDHPVDYLRSYFVGKGIKYASKSEYLRDMLEKHRHYAIRYQNQRSFFIRYPDFIHQFKEILFHFDLHFNDAEIALSEKVMAFESKIYGEVPFQSRSK